MSYVSSAIVNRLLGPHKITTDSKKLTTEDLEQLAKSIDGEIGTKLAILGVLPVPATDPFGLYLTAIASWGLAAQVFKILFPDVTGPGETPAYAYWEKKYQAALTALEEKGVPVIFLGGVTTGAAIGYFSLYPNEEPEPVVGADLLDKSSLFHVDDLDEHPW